MNDEQEVEAEVVEAPAQALEVRDAGTLFRTNDPAEVVKRAQETAMALKPVIEQHQMMQDIGGKLHPKVEGLQTLGTMLGITAVNEWTHKTERGWEARAVVQTLDGRVIGAAESQCDRDEALWKDRDEHALRSMAQTRATSKALASVLRFVLVLAGFSGTPAEEMPKGAGGPRKATVKQIDYLDSLLAKTTLNPELVEKFTIWARSNITAKDASRLIEGVKKDAEAGGLEALRLAEIEIPSDVPLDESA